MKKRKIWSITKRKGNQLRPTLMACNIWTYQIARNPSKIARTKSKGMRSKYEEVSAGKRLGNGALIWIRTEMD